METVFKNARAFSKRAARFTTILVAEKMRVQGFHYPFPANGFVEKDGNGYPLAPALAVLPHLSKGRPVRAPFVFWLDRETAGPYSPRP